MPKKKGVNIMRNLERNCSSLYIPESVSGLRSRILVMELIEGRREKVIPRVPCLRNVTQMEPALGNHRELRRFASQASRAPDMFTKVRGLAFASRSQVGGA